MIIKATIRLQEPGNKVTGEREVRYFVSRDGHAWGTGSIHRWQVTAGSWIELRGVLSRNGVIGAYRVNRNSVESSHEDIGTTYASLRRVEAQS